MSHTRGTWTITQDANDPFWHIVIKEQGGKVIANIHLEDAVDLANARLIAAAPELLETCKAVLDAIEQADLNGTVLWINPPYQAAAVHESASQRLMNVIADATRD